MRNRIKRWAIGMAAFGMLLGCGGGSSSAPPAGPADTDGPPEHPPVTACSVTADCADGEFCSASAEAGLKFPEHYQNACIEEASMECFKGNCTLSGMCTNIGTVEEPDCVPTNAADCYYSDDCTDYDSCIFETDACVLPAGNEPDTSNPNTPKPGVCPAAQPDTPSGCGFDVEKQGKQVGDHVKNFGLKTWEQCAHYLHQDCGGDTKAIWLILSTGW